MKFIKKMKKEELDLFTKRLEKIMLIISVLILALLSSAFFISCSKEPTLKPISINEIDCLKCTFEAKTILIVNGNESSRWDTVFTDSVFCNLTDDDIETFESDFESGFPGFEVRMNCERGSK